MRKKSCVVSVGLFVLALLAVASPAEGASGVWERAWGKGVDTAIPGIGPEICVLAANCDAAFSGSLAGGEFDLPTGIAADAAGNVYVADPSNNRVQKFDSNGNFLRMWGKDVASAGTHNTGTDFEICVAGVDTCKAGEPGGLGGEMDGPQSVAVDDQGSVYVADGNRRIQKFNSAGTFFLAWGKDVVSAGPDETGTGLEICDASLDDCQAGGFPTGAGGELSQMSGIAAGAGAVYVIDGFSPARVQKFDATGNFLRMWGRDVVAAGPGNTGTGPEICTVAVNCKFAVGSTGAGGEFQDLNEIAVDASGDVYVTETGSQVNRVQKFASNGAFLRMWGKDVVSAGPDNAGTGPEICVVAVDTCQDGVGGGAGGEFGSPLGLATDSAGAVYVGDGARIEKFDASGSFIRAWGLDVVSAGPGNTGTGLEICVALIDTCKAGAGASPALGGQLGSPAGLATDSAGNLYVVEQGNSRVEKFIADPLPETTIAAGPGAFAASSTTFALDSSDPGSTFECSLDGGAFAACPSSFSTPALADGDHQLQARAIDPARQVDATAASRSFAIDTTAPETTIDSGPAAGSTSNATTPTFKFSSSEPGSTFECRVDGAAFAACSGPHTTAALAAGAHTFEVRATDEVGNVDPTSAARAFTIDGDPPRTTIDKAPKRKSFKHKAKFEFSSSETGSSFECKLDEGDFTACAANAKFKVKPGKHKLEVRATDAAGNVDPTPAKAKWKVKR